MTQRISLMTVVLVLLLGVVETAAQVSAQGQRTIEVGLSRFAVAVDIDGTIENDVVSGGFFATTARVGGRTDIYGAINWLRDADDALVQAGAQFRLGPAQWIARPSLRAGIIGGKRAVRPSGGIGVHIGRDLGGLFTVDFTAIDGASIGVGHFGGVLLVLKSDAASCHMTAASSGQPAGPLHNSDTLPPPEGRSAGTGRKHRSTRATGLRPRSQARPHSIRNSYERSR